MRVTDVEGWLESIYVAAEGASLRQEDRRKARQVAAMLVEIERAAGRVSRGFSLVLVDAAAGKSYVGLLAAKLVFEPAGRDATVVTIEREAERVMASRVAADRLRTTIPIDCRHAAVGDLRAWPPDPSIVVALHACGAAADTIIDRTIATRARMLLLVPCCTTDSAETSVRASRHAEDLAIPRHAPVRRRFIQAMVDAERTWRLEAAGYETEVVEFVGATCTPHNLPWRSRFVGEPAAACSGTAEEAAWRQRTRSPRSTGRPPKAWTAWNSTSGCRRTAR